MSGAIHQGFFLTELDRSRLESFRIRHRTAVLAIVFTDIVGSTELKDKLGDESGLELIAQHHSLLRKLLSDYPEAEEISTAGDSFFLVFLRPSDAVEYAYKLRGIIDAWTLQNPLPVRDRIGIHAGEVLIRETPTAQRGVFGVQVDIASRVMSLAGPGRIMLTSLVHEAARQTLKSKNDPLLPQLRWQSHGRYQLKGVEEPVEIWEIGDPLTDFGPPPASDKAQPMGVVSNTSGSSPGRPTPAKAGGWSRLLLGSIAGMIVAGVLWMAANRLLREKAPETNETNALSNTELLVKVRDAEGHAIPLARCQLIVGGFPFGANGLPTRPNPDNDISKLTAQDGSVRFRHERLRYDARHILRVQAQGYCENGKFLEPSNSISDPVEIVLFRKKRVTVKFAFSSDGSLTFDEGKLVAGRVTLYPMENGSYRPPAKAFYSFRKNGIVGSSGVLDVGISVDQRGADVFFAGSNGRFDHCTDLGKVQFDKLSVVDPTKLMRERKDVPMHVGHTYIYESNIYPPEKRTAVTGYDVTYAKILVEAVEEISTHEAP